MATWAKGIDFKNSNNTSRIGGIGIYGTDSTINKLYIGLGVEPWNNAGLQLTSSAINFKGNKIYHAGDKPTASEIGAAASSHTHNYMPHTKYTTTQDANNIKTTGVYSFNATCTNAATSNHGTLIAEFNVGTPYQLWMPDNANIIYKRNYTTSSDTWGSWNNTLANNISGNASTATTLQTARTLTIGNTGKSFNGSGNISWSLSEIGAAASSHSHNSLTTKGTNTINSTANDTVSNWGAHGHSVHWYTQSGCLNGQPSQYGYILNLGSGTEVHQLWMTQASGNLAHRGGNGYGWNGSWKTILDSSNFTSYAASANHSHSNYAASSHTHNMISMKSGHVSDWTSSSAMNGKTYMGGWHGNLTSGTAGYISLGANGSSTLDLFIDGEVYVKENQKVYHPGNKPTAADIGAAASNHSHSYLPLSGGTMTGTLALKPGGSTLTGTGIATGNTQLIGTGTDTIYFGNPKTKIILESNSTPSVSVNGTTYTMYHTGNKPTASEIGAAPTSHNHTSLSSVSNISLTSGLKIKPGGDRGVSFETTEGKSITLSAHGDLSGLRHVTLDNINNYNIAGYSGGRWNCIPTVNSSGFMEIGKIIDFHSTNTDSSDYNLRVEGSTEFMKLNYSSNVGWLGFYRPDAKRWGYIGCSSSANSNFVVNADIGHLTLHASATGGAISFYPQSKYVYTDAHSVPDKDNTYYLGTTSPVRRWKQLCAVTASIATSDSNYKTNIEPIINEDEPMVISNLKNVHNPRAFSTTINTEKATKSDYYEFIRDRFKPYSYEYIINDIDECEDEFSKEDKLKCAKSIGFVADEYDLENDKVAREFIFETSEGILNYNTGNYTTVIAIALKESINKIEILEYENQQLKEKLSVIEQKLGLE